MDSPSGIFGSVNQPLCQCQLLKNNIDKRNESWYSATVRSQSDFGPRLRLLSAGGRSFALLRNLILCGLRGHATLSASSKSDGPIGLTAFTTALVTYHDFIDNCGRSL